MTLLEIILMAELLKFTVGVEKALHQLQGPARAETIQRIDGSVGAFGNEILATLETNIQARTPVSRGLLLNATQADPVRPVSQGRILKNWRGKVAVNPPAANYADVVNFGRKPGAAPPPFRPIREWVQRSVQQGRLNVAGVRERPPIPGARQVRGRVPRKQLKVNKGEAARLDRVAWAIRRSIAKKGIKGKQMFKRGTRASIGFLRAKSADLGQQIARHLALSLRGRS